MAFFLGIDGGGTKTDCAVGDERSVLGRATAAGSKVQRVGEPQARAELHAAIRHACAAAKIPPQQVAHACIGIAGASDPIVAGLVRGIVAELVPGAVDVVGDMAIAMQAAFGATPGVIVVAGTGSIAYGRNARGETARAGGWGPVVSDEGSGDWIGRQAVAAAVHAYDTGQSTTLSAAIAKAWHIGTREDIVRRANTDPRPDFAALFPHVLAVADQGDPLAQSLLVWAGGELAGLAKIVIRRLWPGRQPVRVCLAGGVLRNSELVRRVVSNTIRSERLDAAVSFGNVHPATGALQLARLAAQHSDSPSVPAR